VHYRTSKARHLQRNANRFEFVDAHAPSGSSTYAAPRPKIAPSATPMQPRRTASRPEASKLARHSRASDDREAWAPDRHGPGRRTGSLSFFFQPSLSRRPSPRLADRDARRGLGRLHTTLNGPLVPALNSTCARHGTPHRSRLLCQNGNGKSTFIAASIAFRLARQGQAHARLRIAYFSRDRRKASTTRRLPVPALRQRPWGPLAGETKVRSSLGAAASSARTAQNAQGRRAVVGRKTRLLLPGDAHAPPHMLLLDDRTNHLTWMPAPPGRCRQRLLGCRVLVSHDPSGEDGRATSSGCGAGGKVTPFERRYRRLPGAQAAGANAPAAKAARPHLSGARER